MIQQFHFWVYTKKAEKRMLKGYLYNHVHSSQRNYSPIVEAIQMSINRYMDKQNLKEKGNSDTCNNMNEPWGHNSKWEKINKQEDKYCVIPLIWGTQVPN